MIPNGTRHLFVPGLPQCSWWRVWAAVLLLSGILPGQTMVSERPQAAAVVRLSGELNEATRVAFVDNCEAARNRGADVILVDMRVTGCLPGSALELSRHIKRQERVKLVAFVRGDLRGAAVLPALACSEMVLAPDARIGPADGLAPSTGSSLAAVVAGENPILADVYDSTVRRGYETALIEAMVFPGRTLYAVEDAEGLRRFVGADEYRRALTQGFRPWSGPSPVHSGTSLLAIGADLAQKAGLVREPFASPASLAAKRNLDIRWEYSPAWWEFAVGIAQSPWARLFLIVGFLLGLQVALHDPGKVLPEVICLVSLALLLGLPLWTGYAQWYEILTVLMGIGLVAAEVLWFPGLGLAGLAGLALILAGLILTFAGKEPETAGWLPALSSTWQGLGVGAAVVAAAFVISAVAVMLTHRGPKTQPAPAAASDVPQGPPKIVT